MTEFYMDAVRQMQDAGRLLGDRIDLERDALDEQQRKGKVKPLYVKKMASLLDLADSFLDSAFHAVRQIATARQIVDSPPDSSDVDVQVLRARCRRLERENRLLRLALRARGGDPDLLPYMRESDFFI